MEPRIEYDNPFMIGRPEGIAKVEKPRQEDRRRRNTNHGAKRAPAEEGKPEESETQEKDLGKRIDLEA